jgi:hypothetical protein
MIIDKIDQAMVSFLKDLYSSQSTLTIPFYTTTVAGYYLPSVSHLCYEVNLLGPNLSDCTRLEVDVYNVTITTQTDALHLFSLKHIGELLPQMPLSKDLKRCVHEYLKDRVEIDAAVHHYKYLTGCSFSMSTVLQKSASHVHLRSFHFPTSHLVVNLPESQIAGLQLCVNGNTLNEVPITFMHNMSIMHLTKHQGLITLDSPGLNLSKNR